MKKACLWILNQYLLIIDNEEFGDVTAWGNIRKFCAIACFARSHFFMQKMITCMRKIVISNGQHLIANPMHNIWVNIDPFLNECHILICMCLMPPSDLKEMEKPLSSYLCKITIMISHLAGIQQRNSGKQQYLPQFLSFSWLQISTIFLIIMLVWLPSDQKRTEHPQSSQSQTITNLDFWVGKIEVSWKLSTKISLFFNH